MINLLPPSAKDQIKYSKLNRLALRYVRVTLVVVATLAVILVGGLYYLNMLSASVEKSAEEKQKDAAQLGSTFLPKAKDASERLNAVKYVQSTQTHFSAVIADLAKVLPKGVQINNLTLTGQDSQPVSISVDADSYESVLAFRNALVTSPRLSAADIVSITQGNGNYQATVVVAFRPGQSK